MLVPKLKSLLSDMALNFNIIFRDFRVLLRFSRLKSDLDSQIGQSLRATVSHAVLLPPYSHWQCLALPLTHLCQATLLPSRLGGRRPPAAAAELQVTLPMKGNHLES